LAAATISIFALIVRCAPKSFSTALNIPLIEVNHMQAHILAHFIEDENTTKSSHPSFPAILRLDRSSS
jgi:tRNA A37 threonylcarbamoyltransferase TsaD